MTVLLRRELKIGLRNPRIWLSGLLFFLLFLTVLAIGLNGEAEKLQVMAAPAIWLALLFCLLLTFENIFEADIRSGVFEQLHLSNVSNIEVVSAKIISGFIVTTLPILLAIPVGGIFYQLPASAISALMLSALFGAPALIAYSVFAASILAGQRQTGFIGILITLPFLIPVIIFALAGVESYATEGIWNPGFRALLGLSMTALAICIPASAAALKTYLD